MFIESGSYLRPTTDTKRVGEKLRVVTPTRRLWAGGKLTPVLYNHIYTK